MTYDATEARKHRATPRFGRLLGGIWRLTVPRFANVAHALTVVGVTFLLGLAGFAMLRSQGGRPGYLAWLIGFYVTFLVPVFAFINAAGAIRDDLKPSSVDYVFTRPIPRPAFLAFRYVAHNVFAQLEFAFAAAVLVALGAFSGIPDLVASLPRLLTAQALLVIGFTAFGFLSGMLTSRYVVVGLAYGAIVEVGVGQIPTQISRLSMTHQARALLQSLDPAAALNPAADPTLVAGWTAVTLMLLGFAFVCLAIAAALFHFREFSGTTET